MPGRHQLVEILLSTPAAWPLGALAIAQLLSALRRLRATTLVGPVLWAVAAVAMIVVSQTFGPIGSAADRYLGYTAGILLLAPGLAVLGAKRPQNRAWHFIVASFVGILLLPVANGLAAGAGGPDPHPLFRWLNLAVLLVGGLNYLPTIYFFSIAAGCLGAAKLLGPCLPVDVLHHRSAWDDVVALYGLNLAAALAWWAARRRRSGPLGMQRLWSDFRDAYGMVWGVRVLERLNLAARRHGWPVEFGWRGVHVAEAGAPDNTQDLLAMQLFKSSAAPWRVPDPEEPLQTLDPDVRRRIDREFKALLLRFVSRAWIADRDDFEADRGVSHGVGHTGRRLEGAAQPRREETGRGKRRASP